LVKKILEDISHILHTAYESIERIIIALAKKMGISRKTESSRTTSMGKKPQGLSKMRSMVYVTFIMASLVVISVNGVDMTDLQDKGTLTIQKRTIPIGAIMCTNCNGTGNIKEEYNVTESVSCDNLNCDDGYIYPIKESYGYEICMNCDGDGIKEKIEAKIRKNTCPICKGKGYLQK
jgi:hypothetical protein